MAQSAKQVFTPEQAAWLEKRLNAPQASGGAATDIALLKRDVRWIIAVGTAILAGLVYVYLDIDSTLDAHGERLAGIENTLATHGDRLDRIEDALATHGERLGKIESALGRIETLLAE